MSDLRALYQEAFDAFVREDYDEAVRGYLAVIDSDPSFVLAYQGLAEVYSRKDQLDDAIATIQKAIELDPQESLYHTSLSRFLQRQGKVPEAETAAAEAARLQVRSGS
ncbi:MAG: tetratricopeptide repeat protein [Myxococcota bacterium]